MLHEEASDYPVYVYQSELSKAFSKNVELDVEVDMTEYMPKFPVDKQSSRVMIKLKESLVTSFNEVLKNLLRKLYKDFALKLKPAADRQFVLKADGYRDYLRGNDSLLAYERVRIVLRKREVLKLILTEIPKKNSASASLPILRIGINDRVDYSVLARLSPLFWFPSSKIGPGSLEVKMQRNIVRVDSGRMIKFIKKKPTLNLAHPNKIFRTDPATINEHMPVLLSGECNFRFRFKIVGIERLHLIFNELEKPVATDNGKAKPSNITLPSQYKSMESNPT